MIEWISTKESEVPKDGSVYLAIWKGAFCIVSWDEGYYISLNPSQYTGSHTCLNSEAELKIYYWAELSYPQEWLDKK